jgi:GNAT superfamily N-acetyltransferase
VELRVADGADTGAVLALYDEAVAWLAARGRADQWGTTPFSARPDVAAQIRSRVEGGTMWLVEADGRLLGAIALGREAPHYVDGAAEPQIYITGFITARGPHARGAGRVLLEHAWATARREGIELIRLDCYAGGDGGLVAYYESVGFRRVRRFTVELLGAPYDACLLEQRKPLCPVRGK